MKLLIFIASLLISISVSAQPYDTPSEVLSGFYRALESESDSARVALLKDVFLDEGSIHTVIQRSSMRSSLKGGGFEKFIQGSQPFYDTHTMSYDEVERSIDYYVDAAIAHSLVFKVITEKSNPETTYEQMLWFNHSMVFQNERWYLTNTTWINAFADESIDDAMASDTLWHRISK